MDTSAPAQNSMTPPANFQLEEFFLSKLHLDYRPPEKDEKPTTQVNVGIDDTVGVLNVDKNRFRMNLTVNAKELNEESAPVGLTVESEIVGFFSLDSTIPEGERQIRARVNGVSILYGILRGIVASSTGVFEGGKFSMPSINAMDVVNTIEKNRIERHKNKGSQPKTKASAI